MPDEADIANDAILADLERRLEAHRAAQNRPPVAECDECEEPIEPGRVALRLRLCLECARLRERRAKLFARE